MPIGRFLEYESGDLHFNLALEQAILTLHRNSGYHLTLRMWRNPRSVILGRGQQMRDEVNLDYCAEKGISIGRRISAGGAVYQDEGNLNISLFAPRSAFKRESNIQDVATSITELLMNCVIGSGFTGIERDGNHSILHNGRKVSGSAMYLAGNWVLHHATLLISADLEQLEGSLHHSSMGGHRSVYRPTANLSGLDIDQFKNGLLSSLENRFRVKIVRDGLSDAEKRLAAELRESMYSKPDWIVEGRRIAPPSV